MLIGYDSLEYAYSRRPYFKVLKQLCNRKIALEWSRCRRDAMVYDGRRRHHLLPRDAADHHWSRQSLHCAPESGRFDWYAMVCVCKDVGHQPLNINIKGGAECHLLHKWLRPNNWRTCTCILATWDVIHQRNNEFVNNLARASNPGKLSNRMGDKEKTTALSPLPGVVDEIWCVIDVYRYRYVCPIYYIN